MQKNLVLAIILSSLVYILWYAYIEKTYKIKPKNEAGVTQSAVQPEPVKPFAQKPDFEKYTDMGKSSEKTIVKINMAKCDIQINPQGASITSFKYHGPVQDVELVFHPSPGILSTFPDNIFRLIKKDRNVSVFETPITENITVRKKYVFNEDTHINNLEITAINNSAKPQILEDLNISIGPGIGTVKNEAKENPKIWKGNYTVMEQGKKHPTLKSIKESTNAGNWLWAGIDNRYFLMAVLGNNFPRNQLLFSSVEIKDTKAPFLSIPFEKILLNPGETKTWEIPFYVGPKDYTLLKSMGHGLDRSVDFGFFAPMAKLADSSLIYFYKLTDNYGVSIVILSIIVQIILFPLSWKSYKAMNIMKKLQPQLQYLQQKYKDDPKRLNSEIMEMYKKHGTNPLGGCLPMLLQIPVFFALFNVLRNSWNLHGTPFMFWIKDLSSKDPYYVLPIVMGLIMFLQQHLTPQSAEPSQAKIMKWMPVIFTFMFLSFPSGLVLYWLVNSIFGFGQQLYMQKALK